MLAAMEDYSVRWVHVTLVSNLLLAPELANYVECKEFALNR
jgi:hypothetical protein